MARSLSLELPEELWEFVDANCGESAAFENAADFVCHLLKRHKDQLDGENFHSAIIEGYHDAIEGRTVEFKGSLRELMKITAARSP